MGSLFARTVKPHSAGEMRLEVWRGKAWRASTRSPDYTKFIVLPSAKSTQARTRRAAFKFADIVLGACKMPVGSECRSTGRANRSNHPLPVRAAKARGGWPLFPARRPRGGTPNSALRTNARRSYGAGKPWRFSLLELLTDGRARTTAGEMGVGVRGAAARQRNRWRAEHDQLGAGTSAHWGTSDRAGEINAQSRRGGGGTR